MSQEKNIPVPIPLCHIYSVASFTNGDITYSIR